MKNNRKTQFPFYIFSALLLTSCSMKLPSTSSADVKQVVHSIVSFKSALPEDYSYKYISAQDNPNLKNAMIENKRLNMQIYVYSLENYDPSNFTKSLPVLLKEANTAKIYSVENENVGGKNVPVKHIGFEDEDEASAVTISVPLLAPAKHADFLLIRPVDSTTKLEDKNVQGFLSKISAFL